MTRLELPERSSQNFYIWKSRNLQIVTDLPHYTMNPKAILLLFSLSLFSCKEETKVQKEETIETIETVENGETDIRKPEEGFPFDDFRIEKGHLGPIKIGMPLQEAEKYLKDLSRKRCDPFDFGYDGGGDAFIYYLEDKPVVALVPEQETNLLLAIAAIHKDLRTADGLHPNASIKEIQAIYPDISLYQNLMMSWEFLYEEKNDWEFVFMKGPDHQIGVYENTEAPGKVKDSSVTADWVTIR